MEEKSPMLRRHTGWWVVLSLLLLWTASLAQAQDPMPSRPKAPAPTTQPKAKAPSRPVQPAPQAKPEVRLQKAAPAVRKAPARRVPAARPAPAARKAPEAQPAPARRKVPARRKAPEARKVSKERKAPAAGKETKGAQPTQKDTALSLQKEIQKEQAKDFRDKYWSRGPLIALLLIFIAGFFVSLTPCVYPMIPITIAVIGATSQGEHQGRGHSFLLAFLYVVGMAIPYAVLGVVVASIGRLPFMLGGAFNNPFFLGFLVLLFGLMAISMFGGFDLALPTSWQTKMSMFQGKGAIGIVVLGMIGALLATPCSGPVIVGLLAFIAQTGDIKLGILMPTVFTFGIGVPFLVLGGGVVQALPRSGKWMTEVKKVFGVILLAASLYYGYFLARRLIPNSMEYFNMGFAMLMLFLGLSAGALQSYSKGKGSWATLKQTFGIVCLVVGLYLFAGSLLVNGFLLPPLNKLLPPPPAPIVQHVTTTNVKNIIKKVKPRDKCLPPRNHPKNKPFWFKSEKKAAKCAKKLKRPMIIDFWAEWCKSCKELEKKSFNTLAVAKESRRFVMVKYEFNDTSPEDERLRKKYTIPGLPWVRFTNSKGKLLKKPRLVGFVKADKLLKLMRQVH
ncbi:MAG: hypothetical protein EP343_10775 [Deltaproteobacteria bacterium]|nr:MAG: hypothetical protein EP343_10775 [Deltaproteobacteria bacterium]